jgi:hypothetical protein
MDMIQRYWPKLFEDVAKISHDPYILLSKHTGEPMLGK